jgi:hypothetical protein
MDSFFPSVIAVKILHAGKEFSLFVVVQKAYER